jgi:dephospho-CoA kinase
MRIIGVIGQNGSGKDEVLKYLRDRYNIPFLATGDAVRKIAKNEGREPTRENLKEISERYFREMGEGCFVRLVAEKIRGLGQPVAGISGIRSVQDIRILKQIFGNDFVLIEVHVSDPYLRYTRMVKRGEGRDPKSYEQFLKQDAAEEALFHISDAVKLANYSINNDGTLTDMHKFIEKMVKDNGLIGESHRNSA